MPAVAPPGPGLVVVPFRPHATPRVEAATVGAPCVLVLPGFGNDAGDYGGGEGSLLDELTVGGGRREGVTVGGA